jgi:type VI secretion system secreted protein Hcp
MIKLSAVCVRAAGIGAAVLFLFGAGSAHAQNAGYLRVIGPQGALDGASKDPAHMNWIPVTSIVAGDLNGDAIADRESSTPSVSEITATHATVGAGGGGAGKASGKNTTMNTGTGMSKAAAPRDAASGMPTGRRQHKPFVVMKELDKASPLLARACVSGERLKEVDVALASRPGGIYKLTNVLISSDQKSGGGNRPMETISFTYQKIEWTR